MPVTPPTIDLSPLEKAPKLFPSESVEVLRDTLPPVVVVKEPDRVFDDVVVVVIYSLLVKLLDVEVVISFVVVIDSTTFVVLIKVGRLVVLLDLVVTISFVVVKAICPVAVVAVVVP